jgi:hypothetical protein
MTLAGELRDATARLVAERDQLEAELRDRGVSIGELHTEAPELFERFERLLEGLGERGAGLARPLRGT